MYNIFSIKAELMSLEKHNKCLYALYKTLYVVTLPYFYLIRTYHIYSERVGRVLSIIPVIWSNYEFVYESVFDLQSYKFERMQKCFENDEYSYNAEQNAKICKLLARLSNRLSRFDYKIKGPQWYEDYLKEPWEFKDSGNGTFQLIGRQCKEGKDPTKMTKLRMEARTRMRDRDLRNMHRIIEKYWTQLWN